MHLMGPASAHGLPIPAFRVTDGPLEHDEGCSVSFPVIEATSGCLGNE